MTSGPLKPIVMVTWLDAAFNQEAVFHETDTIEDTEIGVLNHSVGYKLRDDKQGIILAMEHCGYDNSYRALQEIPRAYVIDLNTLRRRNGKVNRKETQSPPVE